ncbi:MAG TPA: hypothetical protein VFY84_09590 [Jiangellales bacterium]|nr:hypothetical protein [Jiangellales bacterium]
MERLRTSSASDYPPSPDELVERWRAAEERLALLAVGDPDLYLRHLDVVGQIADRLRRHATTEELSAAYETWRAIVSPLTESVGGELDAASVAGTAWMVRWRELTDARHWQHVAARISAARRRGDSWVTVSEVAPPPQSALDYPYERTMMRLADGIAVRAAIELDADTYGPLYTASILRLDPLSGMEMSTSPSEPSPKRFADRTEWQRGIAALLADPEV